MDNPSVQKVCIIWAVVNLIEQNCPLGEICIDSADIRKFLLCSACAISFLSTDFDWFSWWTSCATHKSMVHTPLPLTTFIQGW